MTQTHNVSLEMMSQVWGSIHNHLPTWQGHKDRGKVRKEGAVKGEKGKRERRKELGGNFWSD